MRATSKRSPFARNCARVRPWMPPLTQLLRQIKRRERSVRIDWLDDDLEPRTYTTIYRIVTGF